MSKWVVLDIEGTLSATDQVLVVLYDYARPRLGPWIEQHGDDPVVVDAVKQIKELSGHDDVVKALHDWMDADQKVTPLKTLQGLIWQQGYAQGDLVAEFFPDVVPAIRKWHDDGLWRRINDTLRDQVRRKAKRKKSPSIAIVDSQDVRASE